MEGYNVKIIETSKTMTAKEKVRIKDFTNALQLDDIIQPGDHFVLDYDFHALMEVHNDLAKGDNKDYQKCVVVDKSGQSYITGSQSFITAMHEVLEEMSESGEEFQLDCYKADSKNYSGKQFLTCTVI